MRSSARGSGTWRADRAQMLEAQGWTKQRSYWRMVRDPQPTDTRDDFRAVTPDDAPALYAIHEAAFSRNADFEPQTEAAWTATQPAGQRHEPRALAHRRRPGLRARPRLGRGEARQPARGPPRPPGSRSRQPDPAGRVRRCAMPGDAQRCLRQPERRAPLRARRDAPALARRRLSVGAATLSRRAHPGQHRRSRRPHADGRSSPASPRRAARTSSASSRRSTPAARSRTASAWR